MARKQFCVFFRPDLVETLFIACGQLLSLILARQHQKVADPCSRQCGTYYSAMRSRFMIIVYNMYDSSKLLDQALITNILKTSGLINQRSNWQSV